MELSFNKSWTSISPWLIILTGASWNKGVYFCMFGCKQNNISKLYLLAYSCKVSFKTKSLYLSKYSLSRNLLSSTSHSRQVGMINNCLLTVSALSNKRSNLDNPVIATSFFD